MGGTEHRLVPLKKGLTESGLSQCVRTMYRWHRERRYPDLIKKVGGRYFWDTEEWKKISPEASLLLEQVKTVNPDSTVKTRVDLLFNGKGTFDTYLLSAVTALGGRMFPWAAPNDRMLPKVVITFPNGNMGFVDYQHPQTLPCPIQEFYIGYLELLGFEAAFFSRSGGLYDFLLKVKNKKIDQTNVAKTVGNNEDI